MKRIAGYAPENAEPTENPVKKDSAKPDIKPPFPMPFSTGEKNLSSAESMIVPGKQENRSPSEQVQGLFFSPDAT
jgi:hypothetical protein